MERRPIPEPPEPAGQLPAGRILGLESATVQCSVALLSGGVVTQRIAAEGARNSEVLLPMVWSLLAEAGVSLNSLDAIAFGAGPGAFTGLRVACGVAQGLAFGLDRPVLPVGTLEVLAETICGASLGPGRKVLAGLDARMGECYWASLQRNDGDWTVLSGPLLARPEAIPLPEGHDWLAVGDAFQLFGPAFQARLGARYSLAPGAERQPEAAALVRLAARRWRLGGGLSAEAAQPVYVRDKVAQTSLERAAR
jgi:tRNA threonylcarbamoyladenosine biosynthesis protein TsaB